MQNPDLGRAIRATARALGPGPVALIFAEDGVELAGTLAHHRKRGFSDIVLFAPPALPLPEEAGAAHVIACDTMADGVVPEAVNRMIAAVRPGTWLYYCYNAEYLFHPFCDSRTVGEMLAFHAEERRDAMLTYVVDLYAPDLSVADNAVSVCAAHLDRTGYYALAREDATRDWQPKDRQLDFYGGLRWRFEEHVPHERRRIDRVGLFRARRGLHLREDHTFDDEEYNTFACPWHHNLTAVIASFRTAKALRSNPGSRAAITSFAWHNSVPFDWTPQQLLDLGLMEPGQWF